MSERERQRKRERNGERKKDKEIEREREREREKKEKERALNVALDMSNRRLFNETSIQRLLQGVYTTLFYTSMQLIQDV